MAGNLKSISPRSLEIGFWIRVLEWAKLWRSLVKECRVKSLDREIKKLCSHADHIPLWGWGGGVFKLVAGIWGQKKSS